MYPDIHMFIMIYVNVYLDISMYIYCIPRYTHVNSDLHTQVSRYTHYVCADSHTQIIRYTRRYPVLNMYPGTPRYTTNYKVRSNPPCTCIRYDTKCLIDMSFIAMMFSSSYMTERQFALMSRPDLSFQFLSSLLNIVSSVAGFTVHRVVNHICVVTKMLTSDRLIVDSFTYISSFV